METIYKVGEQIIKPGQAWTDDDGVQHPSNWSSWSEQELTDHGITTIAKQTGKDGRFYYNTWDADGTVTSTAKDLVQLKTESKKRVKEAARAHILKEVPEWKQANLTAHAVELLKAGTTTGPEIDAIQAVWDRVKAIRAHSDSLEAQVDGCADVPALEALYVWPTDANGLPTGYAPIDDWTAVGIDPLNA